MTGNPNPLDRRGNTAEAARHHAIRAALRHWLGDYEPD